MTYILKRDSKKKKVIQISLPFSGYKMKPKLRKHKSLISIKEILIIEKSLTEQVVKTQFQLMYRRLVQLILNILNSEESSSSDCMIARTELEKAEEMMEFKFKKYLNKQELEKCYKKIEILKQKLQRKMIETRASELVEEMKKAPKIIDNREKLR